MSEPITQWFEQSVPFEGILACGIRRPDHSTMTKSWADGYSELAMENTLRCVADLVHGGGRTQVWDAQVRREADDRVIALFRCTQFLLPREDPRTKRQRTQTEVLQTAKNEGRG